MSVESLIQQINQEIGTANEELVKRTVAEQLADIKIGTKNIDQQLMNMIMAQQGISVVNQPLPKPSNLPDADTLSSAPVTATEDAPQIINDIMVGNNVYLYGKAGTGKTYLAKQIGKILKYPTEKVFIINCSQWTSPIQIVGGQTITGYQQGLMVKAWEEGGLLILDELPKLDPNTAGLLNDALAQTADRIPTDDKGDVLKDENGDPIVPTITDGKGDKIKMGGGDPDLASRFAVIATGNTDMKSIAQDFSGNNRQDYSLVDRFAGSYYLIDYNYKIERMLIYPLVYTVSSELREILVEAQATEFISLRTMLNFSRIYEQEMLRKIDSKLAVAEWGGEGKTFAESLKSFIETLPAELQTRIRENTSIIQQSQDTEDYQEFIEFFKKLHGGLDPVDSSPDKWVYDEEIIAELRKRQEDAESELDLDIDVD